MSNFDSIPLPTHPKFKDLTGRVFTRLTVTGYVGHNKHGQTTWRTLCECGTEGTAAGNTLSRGRVKSCGCFRVDARKTHGHHGTPEYNSWMSMWQRCTREDCKDYPIYKDRTPPSSWRNYLNFLADMGESQLLGTPWSEWTTTSLTAPATVGGPLTTTRAET